MKKYLWVLFLIFSMAFPSNSQAAKGPKVNKITVTEGKKVADINLHLKFKVKSDVNEYQIWEKGLVVSEWLSLPDKDANDYYIIAFTLNPDTDGSLGLGLKRTIFIKVRGTSGTSARPGKTTVRLLAPVISSIKPRKCTAGSEQPVVIKGKYFGGEGGGSKVRFGNAEASVISWSDREISCMVPIDAPAGFKNITITSSNEFTSKPRKFTILPFWNDVWTGEFQDTYNSEVYDGPLEYGFLIAWLKNYGKNKISIKLANKQIYKGTYTDQNTFTANRKSKGESETITGTITPAGIEGTYSGHRKDKWGEWSWEGEFHLSRPGDTADITGVYIARPVVQWASCGGDFLDTVNIIELQQTGNLLKGKGLVLKEKYKGYIYGDIFQIKAEDGSTSGRVLTENNLNSLDLVFSWDIKNCWGWSTGVCYISNGLSGVTDSEAEWDLNITSYIEGNMDGRADVTTQGNNITMRITTDEINFKLKGKIYDTVDNQNIGNFIAKNKKFILFGMVEDNTTVSGTYLYRNWDYGSFTGTVY